MEIEKEVILLMSQGDEKAYGIMFRKFYPKVHRFVSMLLKNMDDADDVCQIILRKSGGSARNSRKSKTSIPTFYIGEIYRYQLYFHQASDSDRHRFLA